MSKNYCNFKVVKIMFFQLICDTYKKLLKYLWFVLMTKSQVLPTLLGFTVYIIMERDDKFLLEVFVIILFEFYAAQNKNPQVLPLSE